MFSNIRAFLFFQSERGHLCPQYRSSDEKASFYTILNSFRAFFRASALNADRDVRAPAEKYRLFQFSQRLKIESENFLFPKRF